MSDLNTDASQSEMAVPDAPKSGAPVLVHITLTSDDLRHAYWLVQTKATLSPMGFLRLFFLTATTLTASAIALLAIEGEVIWPLAIIAGLAGPITMLGSVYYRIGTGAKRIFAQQKSLQLPYTLSWTAEHLITGSEQGRATIAWTDLRKIMHDRRIILFHESDVLFRMVPRRALTPEQQAALLQAAQAARARPPSDSGGL